MALVRWVGRAIGLDVHREFCVVAICEDGKVRSAGRVPSTPEGLGLLAESLLATDRVTLILLASPLLWKTTTFESSCWKVPTTCSTHRHALLPVWVRVCV
jgi:hypothetical protein